MRPLARRRLLDLGDEGGGLAPGRAVVVDPVDQSYRPLHASTGETDALPDRRNRVHERVVVDEQFSCLASDTIVRAPQQ